MTARAQETEGLDIQSALPQALLKHIRITDTISIARRRDSESRSPFEEKKILIMCGRDDKLVPWSASEQFVSQDLDVGRDGVKEVFVQEGAGHECTTEMINRMIEFVKKYAI